MTPRPTTKNGAPCWTIDARHEGRGRLYAATRDAVVQKYREKILGIDQIEFTDQDRLAKQELGDRGTLLEAVRHFLAHKPNGGSKNLGGAIADCCAIKEKRNRRPAYLTHLRHVLATFKTFAGDIPCSDVSKATVEKFLDSGQWAPTTRVGLRNRLSAFFAYAVKQGWTNLNPVADIELESIEKTRPHIFTIEQAHRLLDACHALCPTLLPYFTLGMFCGIRPKELQRLPRAAVKLDQSKTAHTSEKT